MTAQYWVQDVMYFLLKSSVWSQGRQQVTLVRLGTYCSLDGQDEVTERWWRSVERVENEADPEHSQHWVSTVNF